MSHSLPESEKPRERALAWELGAGWVGLTPGRPVGPGQVARHIKLQLLGNGKILPALRGSQAT